MKTLDVNEKQKVEYCIPVWLRDEQIKHSIKTVKGRIEEYQGKRDEPIAVVCFGPSLNDTWEEIRGFKHIITCSGAHKFLIERGIVPTWHLDVDPREHKVKLMGEPHKDVEYLMASTCHPAMWKHLDGQNVKLWHVFDNQEEALRTLPRGEWALTGGSSAGLRALTIARFLGFTDFHVFGMDGNEGQSGKHAAEHPNQPKGHSIVVVDGREWKTTPSLLECAKQLGHEMDMLKDCKATMYGDGLCQALFRNYVKQDKKETAIGMQKPTLISASYRDLNRKLHEENVVYGVGGRKYVDTVLKLAKSINTHSILDYGCGKGLLAKGIDFPIWEYDPAIPGKDELPRPADLVVCTDVLEHIEPDNLGAVLDDLSRVTNKIGYFVIHTGPATKTLADGRNAHLIQKDEDWWREQLGYFFQIGKILKRGPELHVIVAPAKQEMKKAA